MRLCRPESRHIHDAGVQTHVVLDLAIVADHDTVRHIDVLSQTTVPADDSGRVDVTEMPDTATRTDFGALVDHSGLVDERLLTQGWSPLHSRGALPGGPGRVNVIDPFRVSP